MPGEAQPFHSDTQADRAAKSVVTLPASVRARLDGLAVDGYPRETCGLLLGRVGDGYTEVADLIHARNLRTDRAHDRFILDPDDFLRAEQRATDLGLDVVGIWHTHPDHPAVPSVTDRDAAWPGYSYLIAAVTRQGVADVLSWRLRDGAFEQEKVVHQ